ncbi:MAG: PilT protein-like [Tardiphaga sp.]|nr:PilT protein-like [Tardiphaga sp.]
MSNFVVDASVAVKRFVEEPDADIADELSNDRYQRDAPIIIMTEVANALIRKTLTGRMTEKQSRIFWRTLPIYFDRLLPVDDLIEPEIELAFRFRHPIYDLIYFETARRLDAPLITADRRFAAKLVDTDLARHVTLLSDWQPE